MSARRSAVLALALVAALGLVAGCSSSGDGSAAKDDGPTATTTTAPRSGSSGSTTSTTDAGPDDAPDAIFRDGWPKQAGGTCDGHEPGKAGVLMTFCNGPARVRVITDGGIRDLRGVCWTNAGRFEVDAGVAVDRTFAGPWPDYVTFQAGTTPGPISPTLVAWISGHEYLAETTKGALSVRSGGTTSTTTGDLSPMAVTLEGVDGLTKAPVRVDLQCGP